jgi:hypothetical protein
VVLISADEAKLPPSNDSSAKSRGITRGPKVELVSQARAIRSPARLKLRFQAFGGAKIDLGKVKVVYLRKPSVDLTPRVKPFINDNGIDVPAAEMPPGDHVLRVDIADSDGRVGTVSFLLNVEQ